VVVRADKAAWRGHLSSAGSGPSGRLIPHLSSIAYGNRVGSRIFGEDDPFLRPARGSAPQRQAGRLRHKKNQQRKSIGILFAASEYELVDFGAGRKLERFGAYLLDRPSPAAEGARQFDAKIWSRAVARFERGEGDHGRWLHGGGEVQSLPRRWTILRGSLVLELKATDFGHVGVFPEQAANWDWIAKRIANAGRRVKLLNLFGYAGASTLAAAAAGAEVVHVDAARNTIVWARRNAELSGLASAPIRWIHEDAATFVRRELKRGNRYDAVVLDPPSYGHGAKGQTWKLAEQLPGLLADCARLTRGERCFMLVTCHTPGFGPEELRGLLADAIGGQAVEWAPLELLTPSGRALPSGAMARTT
jgi:23S rRNA (cytosine1962-C5)-methyltransferase